MRSIRTAFTLAAACMVLCQPAGTAEDELTSFTYRVGGSRLLISPSAVSVPKGIAGSVATELTTSELAEGTYVEAYLRGPSFSARRVLGLPNQPLIFPPLNLSGDYQLDGIRLVDGETGQTVLEGTPPSVPIRVFDEVLVSRVTSRPLTMDEIREKGIVIDETNYSALEFEIGFVVDGNTIPIQFPVVTPKYRNATELIPIAEREARLVEAAIINQEIARTVELPPELATAGLNIEIQPVNFEMVEDPDNPDLNLDIPPIPALLVIPGNIGFLNQFFSVQLFTANASPLGSGLSVHNIEATLNLPPGRDQIPGTYSSPGDDPIRFARVGDSATIFDVLPVVNPGSDGDLGTDDDITRLQPGQEGQAEFLVEGLREGLHTMNIDLTADLDGLAAGTVQVTGSAIGSVLVRNPEFSLAFQHPRTIRSQEPYEASITILNTGAADANDVSVTLSQASISGAVLETPASVSVGALEPGESATAVWRLRAQRTGAITFSQLTGDSGITGRFQLRMGVDERGVALSPDALALPDYGTNLPPALVNAATRVLGQALSTATAAVRPAGVEPVTRRSITVRALEFAEAGQRLQYGESLDTVLPDLMLDWLGGREADAGFDQIMKETNAGEEFRTALMNALGGVAPGAAGQQIADASTNLLGRGEAWLISSGGVPGLSPDAETWSSSNITWRVTDADGTLAWNVDSNLTAGTELTALTTTTNGTGELRTYTLPSLNAGDCLLLSNQVLHIDRECNDAIESMLTGTVSILTEAPPSVITVFQDLEIQVGRPFPSCYPPDYRNYGSVLAVLFSKPMDPDSVNDPSLYTLDHGVEAGSAQVQNGNRLVYINLREPVGVFYTRTLEIDAVADARGNAFTGSVPVATSADLGSPVMGRVIRSDGTGAGNVPVTLTFYDRIRTETGCRPVDRRVAQTFTDETGLFDFDFVMGGVPYSFSATDTEGLSEEAVNFILEAAAGNASLSAVLEEIAESSTSSRAALLEAFNQGALPQALAVAEGLDRAVLRDRIDLNSPRVGGELVVALRFRGRGTVKGQVVNAAGDPVDSAAVNLFPDPSSRELGRGVFAAADGRFTFLGVPLGSFTVEAEDALGRRRTIAGFLEEPGETNVVTVAIVDAAAPVVSGLQGRVFETGGTGPHPGGQVLIGNWSGTTVNNIQAVTDADTEGAWEVMDIPVGTWDVIALSDDGKRYGLRLGISVVDAATNAVNVTLQGTAQVSGRVEYANGQPAANALVAGGRTLVRTDNNGLFTLEGVPLGRRSISAGVETNAAAGIFFPRVTSASLNVVAGADNFVVLRLPARGALTGRVLDLNGDPVPGIRVVIPQGTGFFYEDTDASGSYRFDNMSLGSYTLSSPGPDVSSRTAQNIEDLADQATSLIREDAPEDEIAAAVGDLFSAYAGVDDPLFDEDDEAFNPITWGYTDTRLTFDGQVAVADIKFLPQGTIAGRTENFDGVPVGTRVRLTGLGPDAFGKPSTIIRGERNTDPALGVFSFPNQALTGNWRVQAASPFYPVTVSESGFTTPEDPDVTNVVLRFPDEEETNGRLTGQVLNPDGTPGTSNMPVTISFGDLQVLTSSNGLFDTQIDLPARSYTVTAEDTDNGFVGRAIARVQAGITNFVTVDLLGRGALKVTVLLADGSPADGAAVNVRGGSYPRDEVNGSTASDGTITFFNLTEGAYAVCGRKVLGAAAVAGRSGTAIEADQTNEVIVTLGAAGTIQGTFYQSDGQTPVAFASIAIGNLGYAVTDTNGFFQLVDVPVGSYRILGSDPVNGRSARTSATLGSQGQVVNVSLIPLTLGEVNGSVISSYRDGVVPGAQVTLSSRDGITPRREVTSGPGGDFSFPGTPAAPFSLSARDPNSRLRGTASGELPSGTDAVTVNIEIAGLARQDVIVLEADGVTTASLARVEMTRGGNAEADVNSEGRVAFADLRLGTYSFLASSLVTGQTRSVVSESVSLDRVGQAPDLPMTLGGVGSVTGVVFDADGTSTVFGAAVELQVLDSPLRNTRLGPVFSDFDGGYRFDNVPLSQVRVKAESIALAGAENGTLSNDQQTVTVNVELGSSIAVTGNVVRADGTTPVPSELVSASYIAQSSVLGLDSDITGPDGGFFFNGIPAGPVTVESIVPQFSGIARTTVTGFVNGITLDLGAFILDEDDPKVLSVTPPHTSVDISTTTDVVLTFNEWIQRVDERGIYLRDPAGDPVPSSVIREGDTNGIERIVRLMPDAPLDSETAYELVVIDGERPGGVKGPIDRVEKPMAVGFSSSFTTRDDDPPVIVSFTPTNNAVQIDPRASVRITFSEAITTGASIQVTGAISGNRPGTLSRILGSTVLVFTPSSALPVNDLFTVSVSGVRDLAGNPMIGQPLITVFQTLDTLGPTIDRLQIVGGGAPLAGEAVEIEAVLASPEPDVAVRMSADLSVFGQTDPGDLDLPYTLPLSGSVTIRGIAIDRFGNEGPLAETNIVVIGNDPPTVTIDRISPTNGPVFSGSAFTVDIVGSDDGAISEMRGSVGGAAQLPLQTSTSDTLRITANVSSNAGPGSTVSVTGLALDGAGQSSTQAVLTLNVADGVPPELEILSPTNGSVVSVGSTVSVDFVSSDAFGVTQVAAAVTGPFTTNLTFNPGGAATTVSDSIPLVLPSDLMPYGTSVVVVLTSLDAAGNVSSPTEITLPIEGASPPSVTFLSPTEDTAYNPNDAVDFTVAVTDDVGVVEVRYFTTGSVVTNGTSGPLPVLSTNEVNLSFEIPAVIQDPEFELYAVAVDGLGQETVSDPLNLISTTDDITPPVTVITGSTDPGAGATTTVSYEVLDGMDDLDTVALYYRRNGIGTFNRWTDPDGTNTFGRFLPDSGPNGSIVFDSTKMGGDGAYEFFTMGIDDSGNREPVPAGPVYTTEVFAAGTVWVDITVSTNIADGDLSLDGANLRISNAVVTVNGAHSFGNVDLLGTGVIRHAATTLSEEPGLDLDLWTLTVSSNASVDVSALGYLGGYRSGNNTSRGRTLSNSLGAIARSGGSHGGAGGVFSGAGSNPLYGKLVAPVELGSGGSSDSGASHPGGNGGGRIRINALNIAADGDLRADGEDAPGTNEPGSGSGGSIYLTVRTLSGEGLVSADGGANDVGGGGGRVAVHYVDIATKDTVLIRALGGQGNFVDAGNGTVYLLGAEESNGTLVIDGQGAGSPFSGVPLPPGIIFDNLIIRNDARVIVDEPIVVSGRVSVINGSILTHSRGNTNGLMIEANEIIVDETSSLDVTGKGYRGGYRDGWNTSRGETLGGVVGAVARSGGSYGGLGGELSATASLTYGTPWNPVYLGSGGSSDSGATHRGGNGGGRITLKAAERVDIDGSVRANGENSAGGNEQGCGSGGSIWIETLVFEGTGEISADGGSEDTGGGGGRIAVRYAFAGTPGNFFSQTRSITAQGGKGNFVSGSAGTVWLSTPEEPMGHLIIDEVRTNGIGQLWTPLMPVGPGTLTGVMSNAFNLDGGVAVFPGGLVGVKIQPSQTNEPLFTITGNTAGSVTVDISGGTNLTDVAGNGDQYVGVHTFDRVTLRGGAFLAVSDHLRITDVLRLEENSVLTHTDTHNTYEPGLDVHAKSFFVENGSRVDVSHRGYLGGYRPGNPFPRGRTLGNQLGAWQRSGASYGGYGSVFDGSGSNPIYGDPTQPAHLGSGGSSDSGASNIGGDGGGRIRLVAETGVVHGVLSADGQGASGANEQGSGSGGSIWLTVNHLSGTGMVTALGGDTESGGGGGRVAVEAETLEMIPSQFEAFGGEGQHGTGGPGTVFLTASTNLHGHLFIDAGDLPAPPDSTLWPAGHIFDAIWLMNGADVVSTSALVAVESIVLTNSSVLRHPVGFEPGLILEAERIAVDASSRVDVMGRGYRGGYRTSNVSSIGDAPPGVQGATARSGASHGGYGYEFSGSSNPSYGNPTGPVFLGAGGSSDGGASHPGGNGGGRLTITATNLQVNGWLRADGEESLGFNEEGSGAGGSVWLQVGSLSGTGLVSAAGGGHESSGGGGRIAVEYDALSLATNRIQTYGGQSDVGDGGPGTVFLKPRANPYGTLIIDAGGLPTPSDSTLYPGGFTFEEIHLKNGADVVSTSVLEAAHSIVLTNGATLRHPLEFEPGLTLQSQTLEIDGSSAIDVSDRGYRGGYRFGNISSIGKAPPGLTGAQLRSGGSHGGYGHVDFGAGSNPAYGDVRMPSLLGAGGSSDGGSGNRGGNGGGRLKVEATNLVINGWIRADGGDSLGINEEGSGAGGSIWLQTGSLSGTGQVSVIGGNHESSGGGGRIAAEYTTSTMSPAQFMAYGGQSNVGDGGPGTVYLKSTAASEGDLYIDAGSLPNPTDSTPWPTNLLFRNVSFLNGARVVADTEINASGSVRVLNDSVITHKTRNEMGLHIRADSLEVDATSSLDATARGYYGGYRGGRNTPFGQTQGGVNGAAPKSGGSYGGQGGVTSGSGSNPTYGSATNPVDLGSGGSTDGFSSNVGGNGGGQLDIAVTNTATLNGSLLATGEDAPGGNEAGSGSGGSILLVADRLEGAGTINADGGGKATAGGGGRIAIYVDTAEFDTNAVSAVGGAGSFSSGTDGTVEIVADTVILPGGGGGGAASTSSGPVTITRMERQGENLVIYFDAPSGAGSCIIEMSESLAPWSNQVEEATGASSWTGRMEAVPTRGFIRLREAD